MLFDLPLKELKNYYPQRDEPEDFDIFWKETLQEASDLAQQPIYKKVDFGLSLFDTFDVSFSGYDGQIIKGWFITPTGSNEKLPCVINYVGYGGGRGLPLDWLLYPSAGYASFVMDTRGQGSTWLQGDTHDLANESSGPHFPGFMTIGIENPRSYYYRRVFTDGVQAVAAACANPFVDPQKVVVTGRSQGGGICIAVSGLTSNLAAVMPDVPFLSHFQRAVVLTDEMPYCEISNYLKVHRYMKSQVLNTLEYFDAMHFACRADAPALFSVGLMDTVCPPSTVFGSYNYYAGPKEIHIYDFNQHEGGESHHDLEKQQFLKKIFSNEKAPWA